MPETELASRPRTAAHRPRTAETDVFKLLSPTGHLGFTPIEEASFWAGVKRQPDAIVADSGSCDIGPHPLGADEPASPRTWQEHDLELIFTASRRAGIPMIIGSASDTGTDRGVREFAAMIRDLARRHGISGFRMAKIFSDQDLDVLARRLRQGAWTQGLDGRGPLTEEDLRRTGHAVAVMGVEPILAALKQGADVVIAGRSCDPALFAAPLLLHGHSRDIAYYAGKLLECASFCAEPFAGKESILGTVDRDGIVLEPMSSYQRCTPASVASHAMYERSDPFREYLPGGYVDMSQCVYEAVDERRTRARGSRWVAVPRYAVKLEGAGKVGERALMIVGIRDPHIITRIDDCIAWSQKKAGERFNRPGFQVHYHVYGKNGVMGELEPVKEIRGHEVCVVVEAVAPTRAEAVELANLAGRNFMYARIPGLKGTAGAAAFLSDEVLPARAAYEWTLNHVIEVDSPLELFRMEFEEL
ncbi:MAG: acyclic terpene utilization AtuA family protein [Firmicutes bacterium]|nr:acyclic terpene utilization AtuA family protein [Bacillota bacterium]